MTRRPRGGVLWDLFFITLLLAAAITAWIQRDRLRSLVPASLTLGRRGAPPSPAPFRSAAPFRAAARSLLARHGVRDTDLENSFTAMREHSGERWVEETLTVRRPRPFRGDRFLKDLAPVLTAHRMALLKDDVAGGDWTLELGENARTHLRLVFRGEARPSRSERAKK